MPIIFHLILVLFSELVLRNVFDDNGLFMWYSFLNVLITAHFTWLMVKRNGRYALIHPTVLGSIFFFGISFGLSNIPFMVFSQHGQPASDYMVRTFTNPLLYANQVLFWSIIAHLSMWTGSQLLFQKQIARIVERTPIFTRLSGDYDIRVRIVVFFYISTVVAKIIMISLGVFGFSQNEDQVTQYQDLLGILKIFTALGQVCTFLLAIHFIRIRKYMGVLFFIVALEAFFGLLAGFKSQVFMPFLILSFASFYVRGKLNFTYLLGFLIALQFAYEWVEPFRKQMAQNDKKTYSVTDIVDTYEEAQDNKESLSHSDRKVPIWVSASDRLNMTGATAIAFQYYDIKGGVPEFRLQERLFLLPLMIFVPKVIWSDKPDNDIGNITTKKVLGHENDDKTAVTVSSIGYGLLGWGTIWVIIPIFILVGMVQQFYGHILYNYGIPGLIIFLANLLALYTIMELSLFLIASIRGLIIGYIALLIFLKKKEPVPIIDLN